MINWQVDRHLVNNDYYHQLSTKWYEAKDDPVALLRAESKARAPWILQLLQQENLNPAQIRILDVGCGAGFLTNAFSPHGFSVVGLDISQESLEIAKRFDPTKSVKYIHGDAYKLPFENSSFDVVTCMDFLEHVSDPEKVITEISRVLKPGGLFFFHTFNRNILAYLVVIKGVEWFVKNTPPKLHVLSLFIKPKELQRHLEAHSFDLREFRGLRPKLNSAFLRLLTRGQVEDQFEFVWTKNLLLSYSGWAQKKSR